MNNETLIIGGGPAGSAAAIYLARSGMSVRLFERQTGPHHKVCGEFISFEAAHYLENLGLDLPMLGAQPIRCARFYNGEQELVFNLPFTAWSLSRQLLDSILLTRAKAAGVNLELGTAVKQLSRVNDEWELVIHQKSIPESSSARLSAKTVFLASGKHELRGWQRNAKHNPHNKVIGFKMHFSSRTGQLAQWQESVEIHLFDGGYAGLEPIENGKVNLCFLLRQDAYKACGSNWPAVLDWLGCRSSHLKQRLANLMPLWSEPMAVAGVPYGYIAAPGDSVPGLYRLGDQTAVIPSFAGDGIAIALHTASLAVQVHLTGGDSYQYQQRACRDLTQPVGNAKRLSEVLAHRWGRNAAFTFAQLWPRTVREKFLREIILRTRVGLGSVM